MKIVKRSCVRFGDINQGDVFVFEGGKQLHMKIEAVRIQPSGELVNMITVEAGFVYCAKDDDFVELINCELVVK